MPKIRFGEIATVTEIYSEELTKLADDTHFLFNRCLRLVGGYPQQFIFGDRCLKRFV